MSGTYPIKQEELAERLKTARDNAGLTQEFVAKELGVARTTVVAIEKAERPVKPEELMRFSKLYKTSMNHLIHPKAVHVDLVGRFRRNQPGDTNRIADEAMQILNRLASSATEIENLLGKPLSPHYPPPIEITGGDVDSQAEEAALTVRQQLGLGLAPITDLISLLEWEMKIRVFVRPLDSSISGVFAYDKEVGACILINAKHSRERRAVTAAHEFGHFCSSRYAPEVWDEAHIENSREERFANVFMGAFLMPAPLLRRRFQEISMPAGTFSVRHLIVLSDNFHVSPEAMCRRLEGLKLLPAGTYNSLKDRKFSGELVKEVLGDRPKEADELYVKTPPRLALLATEAYNQGLLSEGQLCDKLMMDRVEVRKLLDVFSDREFSNDL